MNRRTFISTSVAATLAASRPVWAADSAHKIDRIGVQLYTVREASAFDDIKISYDYLHDLKF